MGWLQIVELWSLVKVAEALQEPGPFGDLEKELRFVTPTNFMGTPLIKKNITNHMAGHGTWLAFYMMQGCKTSF